MLITTIYMARFPLLRKGSKTLGRSRSLRFIFGQKTHSEYIQRGFFLFGAQKKCTKNAPNPHSNLFAFLVQVSDWLIRLMK